MITEEQIRQTISKAEESFQDCWAKLSDMKNGEKRVEFLGMSYFIGAIRTQFFADAGVVNLVKLAIDKIEKEGFKEPTRISLDFDFLYG